VSTVREQIVAAAFAALTTGRPAGVPLPVRTRIDTPNPDQLPAFTVYQSTEVVDPMHPERPVHAADGAIVLRTLVLATEVLTKAGAGGEPDKAADPIIAWTTKALGAAGTFGGLANRPARETGTKFEYQAGETSFCRATMTWRYEYQSRVDDAEQVT
jgi:hypothetical protein